MSAQTTGGKFYKYLKANVNSIFLILVFIFNSVFGKFLIKRNSFRSSFFLKRVGLAHEGFRTIISTNASYILYSDGFLVFVFIAVTEIYQL